MNDITIEQIRPELTLKLRHEVLYPERAIAEMKMDEDDDGYHFAAFQNNYIVAVVSLFKHEESWQFRKFAVEASVQGKGIGGKVLQYITDFVINEGGTKLWCNARLTAIPFYLKHDFVQKDEHFSKNGFDYEILEKDLSA